MKSKYGEPKVINSDLTEFMPGDTFNKEIESSGDNKSQLIK